MARNDATSSSEGLDARRGAGPQVIEGDLIATGIKTAVVASRFNHFIVEKLVGGALDALTRHGADASQQTLVWVPGAWELPLAAQRAVEALHVDAVVCIGCVIRGGTPHFDYVAGELSKGIASIAREKGVPVTMGVLTVDTLEQAIERAGTKMGNKGWEAALAAVETVNVLRALKPERR